MIVILVDAAVLIFDINEAYAGIEVACTVIHVTIQVIV